MAICLTTDDLSWSVQIPLDDGLADAILFQLQRAEEHAGDHFQARLKKLVGPALLEALDPDLKPPTPRQLSYARSISNQLRIPIPTAAERTRSAMTEFLRVHVPQLKRK